MVRCRAVLTHAPHSMALSTFSHNLEETFQLGGGKFRGNRTLLDFVKDSRSNRSEVTTYPVFIQPGYV